MGGAHVGEFGERMSQFGGSSTRRTACRRRLRHFGSCIVAQRRPPRFADGGPRTRFGPHRCSVRFWSYDGHRIPQESTKEGQDRDRVARRQSGIDLSAVATRRRLVGAMTPCRILIHHLAVMNQVRFACVGGIRDTSFSSNSTPVMTRRRRPSGNARFMPYAKRPSGSSLNRDDATAPVNGRHTRATPSTTPMTLVHGLPRVRR